MAYPDGSVRPHPGPWAGCGHAVDQDLALLDQPGGIVQAGKAALERGEQRDEWGAPGSGHGGVLLVLGPNGQDRAVKEDPGQGDRDSRWRPAHAKTAAADGSGLAVRRDLGLAESHDCHATGAARHASSSRDPAGPQQAALAQAGNSKIKDEKGSIARLASSQRFDSARTRATRTEPPGPSSRSSGSASEPSPTVRPARTRGTTSRRACPAPEPARQPWGQVVGDGREPAHAVSLLRGRSPAPSPPHGRSGPGRTPGPGRPACTGPRAPAVSSVGVLALLACRTGTAGVHLVAGVLGDRRCPGTTAPSRGCWS